MDTSVIVTAIRKVQGASVSIDYTRLGIYMKFYQITTYCVSVICLFIYLFIYLFTYLFYFLGIQVENMLENEQILSLIKSGLCNYYFCMNKEKT